MELSNLYEVAPRPLMSSLPHSQQPSSGYRDPAELGGEIGDNETSIDLSAYIDPSAFNDDFLADLFHHSSRQDKLKMMSGEYDPVPCGPGPQQLYMSNYMESKLEPLYEHNPPRIRPVAIKQEPRDEEDLSPAMPPNYHHPHPQQYSQHPQQQQPQMPHLQYQIAHCAQTTMHLQPGHPTPPPSEADPRVMSSNEAMAAVAALAPQVLPNGMQFEWTDLSFQQANEGSANLVVFPLAVLLVFLVLAALYESWVLPLAVILIVPICLLAALAGVWLTGGDNNIFVKVGLVVLMGLACKNAILIVEFARELEMAGRGIVAAALEACRLRLRPIVMTSMAFIAGVVPLVLASGAGSEVRHAMGVTVFAGMLGVTLFGLFLTPVFYVGLRTLATRAGRRRGEAAAGLPEASRA